MAWNKVKISSFLEERADRISPEKANEMGLDRLGKIDFSGTIHVSENQLTRTGMILVKKGDLVISGINVEKGALAVYEGDEDLLATIHYSSYSYDKSKIDIEFLKWFLKSQSFRNILLAQTRGGIKTEFKPKRFLPLEVILPDLPTQIEIRDKLNSVNEEVNEAMRIQYENEKLIQKLRQVILSEAIQGKLVSQDPNDEPASVLLEKIKAEKNKLIKKDKSLLPITKDEIPFVLPKSWEWVRLGDVVQINPRNIAKDNLLASFIPMTLISNGFINKHEQEERLWGDIKSGFTHFANDDVGIAKITPCFQNRKSVVFCNLKNGIGAGTTELYVLRAYAGLILSEYLLAIVKTNAFIVGGVSSYTGTAGQQRVKKEYVCNYKIGLPPLSEQKRIVQKVSELMMLCDELEKQVMGNQTNSAKLMNTIFKETFAQEDFQKISSKISRISRTVSR